MIDIITIDIITLVLGMILTALAMPVVIRLAYRYKKLDIPDERKIHHKLIPRLGGVAFIPIALLTASFVIGALLLFCPGDSFITTYHQLSAMLFAGIAICIVYVLGVTDDIFQLRYSVKLSIQFIAAMMIVFAGLDINDIGGILGISGLHPGVACPLTILFVLGMINATNLIDGIDGLCASLAAIAFIIYGIIFSRLLKGIGAIVSFALLGALLAFLYFNVFGNAEKRTKIFMGDSGSMTLGLILSILGLTILSLPTADGFNISHKLIYVFTPLLIPVLDAIRVFSVRISHHLKPFSADTTHIHHRLLRRGLTHKSASAVLIGMDFLFCALNFLAADYVDINIILISDIVIWVVFNLIVGSKKAATVSRGDNRH